MADITKCSGMKVQEVCPLRFDCYRYRVQADPINQSWLLEAPFERERHGTVCEQLWKMESPDNG